MKRINLTLAQVEVFAAIVKAGSFTTASETLGMTQSAVSHAIAALEKELKVSLLVRDRKGIVLTEMGQRVLTHAQKMLVAAEQIRQETSAAVGLETGKVRVGSFPSVSARFLPGLLRQFRQRYPGIDVILFEGTDEEVRQWIYQRTVDIGVVTLPSEGLATVAIARDEFFAVVSENHALVDHSQIRIHQLAQDPFIMSKAGCEPMIVAMFSNDKLVPKIQFEVIDLRTIFAMVREGLGVTIVPEMALPTHVSGLHILRLEPHRFRQLAFAVPSLESASPAVKTFLDDAKDWAQGQGFSSQLSL